MIILEGFKKKWFGFWKWLSLVIIFAVALCGCNLERVDLKNDITPSREVIYPEGFAYDDREKQQALIEQNPLSNDFLTALDDFSYLTASALFADIDNNANYSPISLYFALSIVTAGAKEDTAREMLEVLGVGDIETLSEQCANLYRLLYRDNDICKLKIANSLWLDDEVNGKKIEFNTRFIENTVENFYASLYNVDFSSPAAARAMSEWIAKNTNGKLTPKFEPDPYQVLSIINTIYFYDAWVDSFDKGLTTSSPFYLANGSEVSADFMKKVIQHSIFSVGSEYTRASLNMKNGNQMVFILPDEGTSVAEIVSSPEKIKAAFLGGQSGFGKVRWEIPKYSFDTSYSLISSLQSLGIKQAFTDYANFKGITDHPVLISSIQQDTHIAIDELGAEATAFTKIDVVEKTSVKPKLQEIDMILDRPFIYGIKAPNGCLLFVGIVNNPKQ